MRQFKRVSCIVLVFVFGCYILSSGILIKDSYSHSLFNSAGQIIGKYYVQIATDPEIPTTGEDAKILLRVSTEETNMEVTDIPITVSITKNGVEVHRTPQIVVTEGHYEFDYKFLEPGNYIFYIDLLDLYFTGKIITYTFNIGTLNPFGYIFFSMISIGVSVPIILITIIFIKNKKRAARIAKNQNQNSTDPT